MLRLPYSCQCCVVGECTQEEHSIFPAAGALVLCPQHSLFPTTRALVLCSQQTCKMCVCITFTSCSHNPSIQHTHTNSCMHTCTQTTLLQYTNMEYIHIQVTDALHVYTSVCVVGVGVGGVGTVCLHAQKPEAQYSS